MTTLHNIVLRLPDFEAKEKSGTSNARITSSTPSDRGRRRRISLLSRHQVISSRHRLLDLLCLLQHYKVQGFSLEPDER